jgi:vacuolar-type H+-ATPase subunit E/Vma4
MNLLGSVEAVRAAIREDARAEVERLEREADEAIARLKADAAAAPLVVPDGEVRIRAARREQREQVAKDDWADREAMLRAREEWMESIVAAGAERVLRLSGPQRRAYLLRVAGEALDRIADADVRLLVAPADRPAIDDAARRQLEQASGKRVEIAESAAIEGGCVAETRDRRLRFDNTCAARARRFEAIWRRALGELFDRVVTVHV